MAVKAFCYYKGTCMEGSKYEVWFRDSNGDFIYSRLCECHYNELKDEKNFDYVFELKD